MDTQIKAISAERQKELRDLNTIHEFPAGTRTVFDGKGHHIIIIPSGNRGLTYISELGGVVSINRCNGHPDYIADYSGQVVQAQTGE